MKEYGRKPYISKSYHDMMKKVTNRAKWNQRLEKQSEFEKPYRDDENYAEMQHYHSQSNSHLPGADYPGMSGGGIPAGYAIVFYCSPAPCYCEGQTKCVDLGCTHPIKRIETHFCDPAIAITLSGTKLCVTVPSGVSTGLCSVTVWMEATYTGSTSPGQRLKPSDLTVRPLPEPVVGYHGFAFLMECDDCCGCTDISIGYTTQGMAIDEEQELTVEGAELGCTYNWAITSGGGSLSAETGTSVTYTAPSSNANCANNPTITLSSNGQVCDTLQIAINAASSGLSVFVASAFSYNVATTATNPTPNTGLCDLYYVTVNADLTGAWYNCSGALYYGPCNLQGQVGAGNKYDKDSNLLSTKNTDGKYYLCVDADYATVTNMAGRVMIATCYLGGSYGDNGLAWMNDNSPIDNRSEAQKAAGCCPPQLL